MAENGPQSLTPDPPAEEGRVRARIERAIGRARMVLYWEKVWPRLAPLLALAALFAALSWFGLWRVLPDIVRIVVLVAFGVAAIALLVRAGAARGPERRAALARVERASGAPHRPATAFNDDLATARTDPITAALWTAHRERLLASLTRLKAGTPEPRLTRHDPWALRFLVILVFVVGFFFAGTERIDRIAEAFRGGEPTAATVARVDAWVTPPAYTARAPIFLTGATAPKPADARYSVPAGSVVTVRIGGNRDLDVIAATGSEPETAIAGEAAAPGSAAPIEHKMTLDRATDIAVRKGSREISAWRFAVEPDQAPHIAVDKPPATNASGALTLSYTLGDDYGVVTAEAILEPIAEQPGAGADARPLIPAPSVPLSLPQMRARSGTGETIRDLTAHPWAGSTVRLTLVARDDAGQEGKSAPVEVKLPARQFRDPVARAVVEQRARLAVDANNANAVANALDAMALAPEKGLKDLPAYLVLRSAYYRLQAARNDDGLRDVVDYLWSIALGLEDGDLSLAAEQLRSAQDALRQALENGASDAEIERLTQELREAMQRFMQALMEQAQKNPQTANQPPDPNARMLRSEDLERMLDQIENLARTGARDAARQLLSELQNMLENLQNGQPMMSDQNGQEMMQSLEDLGEMIRRQQELMDKTFRAERGDSQEGDGKATKEELEQALKQLREGQQGLQQSLQELMDRLGELGMDENGKLGQAGEAMGRAAEALGKGQPGGAVGNQGQALDALRQGAQGLAQQFANRGQGGGLRTGEGMPNEDPLGRPQRTRGPDLGDSVKVPDEIDTQRAREILDAIRKRLGETGRPEVELDYLERLLDRF